MSLGSRWCHCRGIITRRIFRNQRICQSCGKEIFLQTLNQNLDYNRRGRFDFQGGASSSVEQRPLGDLHYFRYNKRKVENLSPEEREGDEKFRRRSYSFDSGLQNLKNLQENAQIENENLHFMRRVSSEDSIVSVNRTVSFEGSIVSNLRREDSRSSLGSDNSGAVLEDELLQHERILAQRMGDEGSLIVYLRFRMKFEVSIWSK